MSAIPQFYPAVHRTPDTTVHIDGHDIPACSGDTLIAVLLAAGQVTGWSEFDGEPRSGFCLMGACQDCTLWTSSGKRLRACMTEVQPGMSLRRTAPLEGSST
ncbi:(2Fe-2S)-binding protein [Neorhizobium sp. T786]|uniref:(2Fe-2S)-binding protein n=1 Tax=Pseudorhizobium xiangyangii TaxID=2883104 RepID=UPI001CFF5BFE|nr:(2Fe-2S)-binding protein [Neorhizobium xiangyangii]MCB5201150.1 (2Fe-2S)-binding protein [Neorhizobium xiangyangii]